MSERLDPHTLRAIIGRAADTAATILNMSQKFHASDGMREYARVRAEALVEFSQGLAKLLNEAPPETGHTAESGETILLKSAVEHLEAEVQRLTAERDAPPREAQQGWEDIDGENAAYVNRVTSVVREADRSFEQVGGSSRHWVRDCFLPMLNRAGLRIQPAPDVTCQHGVAMDVHCCNCHNGFIFDADHECPSREAPREPREAARVLEEVEERDTQITEAMQAMAEDEPAVPARGEG